MQNGLYKAAFSTPLGTGDGIVHKVGNDIAGGDAGFAYEGVMSEDDGRVTARLRVFRHSMANVSVFGGGNDFIVDFTGTSNGNAATLTGTTAAAPGVKLTVRLEPLVPIGAARRTA